MKAGDKESPLTFNGLRGVVSQEIEFFTTSAVRTSDPTYCHVTGTGFMTGFIAHFDTAYTIRHSSIHSHIFTAVVW
jgi:hypothetical protein